jgi:hypothetical protein
VIYAHIAKQRGHPDDLALQYWAFLGLLWAAWRWAKRAPERPVG